MRINIVVFLALLTFGFNCKAQGWQNCGDGVQGIPYNTYVGSLVSDTVNNILYVGGDFDTINGTSTVGHIAQWNGTTWSSIPALDSISYAFYNTDEEAHTIDAMIMFNGALYLPASETIDDNGTDYTTYYVIKYDGKTAQWLPALDGQVNCFTVYNDTLYIGGDFVEPDTTAFNHVAKWDGTNWQPVGSGFVLYSNPYSATVYSLGVSNGKLYAGGSFDQSGNTTDLFSIAQWDDTGWTALGRGVRNLDTSLEGIVYAIGSYQNNLYVGGGFGYAGEDTAYEIAEWNGTKWLSLNQQFSGGGILGLQEYNNKLYVGGGANIGTFQGNQRIASWNGTQWDTIGANFNNSVYALTVFQNSLYAGGIFDSTSNMLVNYITHWSPDSTTTAIEHISSNNKQISIYPNPASNQLTLISNQLPIEQLQIEDVLGQTLIEQTYAVGLQRQTINVITLPQGIYFYRLTSSNSQVITGKFVKE